MTIKNRTKALNKAINLYRNGKIPFHVFHHLTGDIVAGHSRKNVAISQRSM